MISIVFMLYRKKPIFFYEKFLFFFYFLNVGYSFKFLDRAVNLSSSSCRSCSASSAFSALEVGQAGKWLFLPGLAQPGRMLSSCWSSQTGVALLSQYVFQFSELQIFPGVGFFRFVLFTFFLPIFVMVSFPKNKLLIC